MKNLSVKSGIFYFSLLNVSTSIAVAGSSGSGGPVLIEPGMFELIAIGTLGMVLFRLKSRNKS